MPVLNCWSQLADDPLSKDSGLVGYAGLSNILSHFTNRLDEDERMF